MRFSTKVCVGAAVVGLASVGAVCHAEQSKPLPTRFAEAMAPIGKGINTVVMETLAGGSGAVAKGAQQSLKAQAERDATANRGSRQPMQACIKAGNLIDDDVRECMNGTRARDW